MHVLKFTLEGGEGPGLDVVIDESIGFGETLSIASSSVLVEDTIGLRGIPVEIKFEEITETIGLGDSSESAFSVLLEETIGLNDSGDDTFNVYLVETIAFNDTVERALSNNITCNETIGFDLTGYNIIDNPHDITFTWRTRTNVDPSYGYGAAEYGAIVSYGDGDASNLVSFEIHIWKPNGPSNSRYLDGTTPNNVDRLTKQVITITDTGDPDADATYTLTAANNVSFSGGVFSDQVEIEVFVKDSNGTYSFAKALLTDALKVYHED